MNVILEARTSEISFKLHVEIQFAFERGQTIRLTAGPEAPHVSGC